MRSMVELAVLGAILLFTLLFGEFPALEVKGRDEYIESLFWHFLQKHNGEHAIKILSYGFKERINSGKKSQVLNISGNQLGLFLCKILTITTKVATDKTMDPTVINGILPAELSPNTNPGNTRNSMAM